MLKKGWLFALVIMLFVLASGCGGNTASKDSDQNVMNKEPAAQSIESVPQNTEPVTLKFYMHVLFSDDVYKKLFEGPIKKKFPNVTLELIKKKGSVEGDIQDLISSGIVPDLAYTALTPHVAYFLNNDYPADLSGYLKKYKVDLNKFDQSMVEGIQSYGSKGEFYAIPFLLNPQLLFYNKDIFDKFAVPYPKDGMTWEDIIGLARRVSRVDGGVQYSGINPNSVIRMMSSLSLPFVDAKTNKAVLTADGWKKGLQMIKQITEIPGNEQIGANGVDPRFIKDKTLAMYVNANSLFAQLQEMQDKGDTLNWDLVTYPTHPEAPGLGSQVAGQLLLVSKTSKHQEMAFQVANYLAEEDVQLMAAQDGTQSVLRDTKIMQAYGANLSVLKGKNLKAMNEKLAKMVPPTRYDGEATNLMKNAQDKVISGDADVNTALREANEQLDQYIEQDKSK